MKPGKFKKIIDEMIGMDDKICSCSSIVGDIIISQGENKDKKASLRKIMDSLRKNRAEGQKEGKE
jgi:hypothetical protein